MYRYDSKGEFIEYQIFQSETMVSIKYREEIVVLAKKFPTVEEADEYVNRKIQERLDNGYRHTKEGASNFTDSRVMLLKSADPNDIDSLLQKLNVPFVIGQPKLNGMRATLDNHGFFSRDGNLISKLNQDAFTKDLKIPYRLDGELYAQGYPLEEIISMVKGGGSPQPLKFYVFDIMIPDVPYSDRLQMLQQFRTEDIIPIDFKILRSSHEIEEYFQEIAIDGRGEGIIIRKPFDDYEFGKRSNGVIKIKPEIIESFPIVDYHYDRNDNVVFTVVVLTPDGPVRMPVVPRWTHAQRNKSNVEGHYSLVGRLLKCRFFEWTKRGLPRNAVGV